MNLFRRDALATLLLAALMSPAIAAELPADVGSVRDRWAEVKYAVPENQRDRAFEALAQQAKAALAAHPDDAGALIWEGIVLSSWAGEKGGLGALGLVKQARRDFERAIELEPAALDGAAYTSLGSLYDQVPGWPLGFGDDDMAGELLRKGLEIDPDGLDANYFYADYLRGQEDYAGAAAALHKALAAPPRPGRERADAGRRAEAEAMLAIVDGKLASR